MPDTKIYYSIREVAEMFGVTETLLRYWEKEFPRQIKPKKSANNVRRYTQSDLDNIRTIHTLLKVRGLKIAAARELLSRNRQGDLQLTNAVARLKSIRAELVALRDLLREHE